MPDLKIKVNTVLPYGSWKTSTQSDEVTLKLLMKYFLQLYNVLGQHVGISKRRSCFTGLLPLYCLWLCLCYSCRSCVGQSTDTNPNPLAGPQWQPHPPHSRHCSTRVIKITYAVEIIFYYMDFKSTRWKETSTKVGCLKNCSLCDWLNTVERGSRQCCTASVLLTVALLTRQVCSSLFLTQVLSSPG